MKLIILPGNHPSNKEWTEKISSTFRTNFDSIYIQYYEHWNTGKEVIDLNLELEKLVKNIDEDCIIIAKSAGIVLTVKGIFEGKLNPVKCVFLGLPIKWCKQNNVLIEKWLECHKVPSLFIQQNEDPFLPFGELNDTLKNLNVKNYILHEVEGNDHSYSNIEEIKILIEQFIA